VWRETAPDGWLVEIPELHHRRAPGNTCVSALKVHRMGSIEDPLNESNGCGGNSADGANRNRTGDLLLANSAAQEVSSAHWASMAERTGRTAVWVAAGGHCFPKARRPCVVPRLPPKYASTLCVARVACSFQKNGKPGEDQRAASSLPLRSIRRSEPTRAVASEADGPTGP
jgi:hypothetical protein